MSYGTLVTHTVDVSREMVFGQLQAFGNLKQFVPGLVEDVHVIGEGIGMERHIRLIGSDRPIIERLDAVLPPSMLVYSIVNAAPLPVRHYVAVIRLEEPSPGRCVIHWGSNWIAEGQTPAEVDRLLSGFYTTIVSNLAEQISRRGTAGGAIR